MTTLLPSSTGSLTVQKRKRSGECSHHSILSSSLALVASDDVQDPQHRQHKGGQAGEDHDVRAGAHALAWGRRIGVLVLTCSVSLTQIGGWGKSRSSRAS